MTGEFGDSAFISTIFICGSVRDPDAQVASVCVILAFVFKAQKSSQVRAHFQERGILWIRSLVVQMVMAIIYLPSPLS
ncbi:MAG: hypothetical protein AB7P14_16795 [Blastocatellales bacterium]